MLYFVDICNGRKNINDITIDYRDYKIFESDSVFSIEQTESEYVE